MPDLLRHHRLRKQAETITDPTDAALVRRLADLQELDFRRKRLPASSPERDALDGEIAKRSRRIHDHASDGDDTET